MINVFKAFTNTLKISIGSGLLVWLSYPFCKKNFPSAVKYDRDKSTIFISIISAIIAAISFFIADNIIEGEDDYSEEEDNDDEYINFLGKYMEDFNDDWD